MSAADGALSLADPDQTLNVLAGFLEGFVSAWDAGDEAPPLDAHLPAVGEVRRFVLVELIKIDLEYRWLQRDLPKRLADYLADFPELRDGGVPADLIYEEFHIRKQAGLQVNPQEYLDQFPAQANEIRCLLGLNEPYVSTGMLNADRRKKQLDAIDVGQQLDDFDLLARLGRGAFAAVFLARQRSMQRLVALKISADHGTEPQTLAQLDHDHIVRVFDQRAVSDQGLRLLYMQYIAGGTLEKVVKTLQGIPPAERKGRLLFETVARSLEDRGESRPVESSLRDRLEHASWTEVVCWIGAKLALALDYAHRRGVLHRDVKPANVLLTNEGVPKLADFNVSFAAATAGISPAEFFGGSLAYMSPEQIEAMNPAHDRRPDGLDGRSDLYSLGVMLWELLTGRRPFTDDVFRGIGPGTLDGMVARRRAGLDATDYAGLPADCPPGVVQVLERCLAFRPEDRWQTGAELSKQFDLCLNPHALDLLHPPEKSWRVRLRPWAVICALILVTLPNLVGSVFTTAYMGNEVEYHLRGVPYARERYMTLVFWINAVAFTIGLSIFGTLTHTLTAALRSLHEGILPSAERLQQLRKRSLLLGHTAALIGVTLWTIAGVVYPFALHWYAGRMPPHAFVQFDLAHIICGFIAAAYPFFIVSWFSIRVLYPGLLHANLCDASDLPTFERLGRNAWRYLLSAAAVPLLGVVAIVVMSLWTPAGARPEERYSMAAMAVLGLGGLAGLGCMYRLFRLLQTDIDSLTAVIAGTDARRT